MGSDSDYSDVLLMVDLLCGMRDWGKTEGGARCGRPTWRAREFSFATGPCQVVLHEVFHMHSLLDPK